MSGNSAGDDGGGIFVNTATLTNSTVTGNSAGDTGGGILAFNQTSAANSIILGNHASTSFNEISGTFAGGNRNIVGNNIFNGNDDIGDTTAAQVFADTVEIAPGVFAGVLADNGGPVQTIALNAFVTNPALDASSNSAPTTDARGEARVDLTDVANANGGAAVSVPMS